MTTQAELLHLAEKHNTNKMVSLLLTSITEARITAKMRLVYVESATKSLGFALENKEGYHVSLDASEFVTAAAKIASQVERMAADFMNLACVLQDLGEDISY